METLTAHKKFKAQVTLHCQIMAYTSTLPASLLTPDGLSRPAGMVGGALLAAGVESRGRMESRGRVGAMLVRSRDIRVWLEQPRRWELQQGRASAWGGR